MTETHSGFYPRGGKADGTAVNSTGRITAQFELVNQSRASIWLETQNNMNRGKRRSQELILTEDMADNQWEDNGEPITFDWNGELVNGQHRLTAVRDSGAEQEFLIVRGVDPKVRSTIDANSRRRFADDLTMNGEKQAVLREALLRSITQWDRTGGLAHIDWRPSRRFLTTRYPIYQDQMTTTLEVTQRWRGAWPGNKVAMAFTWWLLTQRMGYDQKVVNRFMSILAIGSQDPVDARVVTMRQRIARPVAVTSGGHVVHMHTSVEVYWLIQAWNRWITGSQANFVTPANGIMNPYPQPEDPEAHRD